jgi:hypothetical protein
MSDNDFKSLSDERLIKMTKEPPSSIDHVKAAIELHKRQKEREDKIYSVEDSTRKMTFIILVVTILSLLAILYQCDKPFIFAGKISDSVRGMQNFPQK